MHTCRMPYLTISGLFVEIWIVCSPEEAQGNEKALVNACLSAGHLDPEISRCSVLLEKKIALCAVQKKHREMKRPY